MPVAAYTTEEFWYQVWRFAAGRNGTLTTAPFNVEEAQRQMWRWLTANGASDPATTSPVADTLLSFGFDDTNVAASVTNQAMSGLGASSEGDFVPFPFSVVGIGVRGNADCTAGSATFEAMLDGVATGLTAVINTTNPRQKGTTQATGLDAVAASGRIGCRYTTSADFLPTGSTEYEVYIYILADMSGVQ